MANDMLASSLILKVFSSFGVGKMQSAYQSRHHR